ncbi:hypothetical protein QJS10_CPA16g01379 [Acorus calamus]|uniref:Uncharacterized protein n=1 Tax=Acorus calamus TaxID=4465 RepID=A0AAV9D384_ACOCL|nr:hypothetical protein QJS10_CPA16g01379 [Acorus calamus]
MKITEQKRILPTDNHIQSTKKAVVAQEYIHARSSQPDSTTIPSLKHEDRHKDTDVDVIVHHILGVVESFWRSSSSIWKHHLWL